VQAVHIHRGKRTLGIASRNSNYVPIPLFRILSPPLVLKVVEVVFREVIKNVNAASVRHQAVGIDSPKYKWESQQQAAARSSRQLLSPSTYNTKKENTQYTIL